MAFAAGEKLTAAKLNAEINPLFAYKPTNEGLTNSTLMQNDDHLFVSVATNSVYTVEARLGVLADPTIDGQIRWTFPTGTRLDWGMQCLTQPAPPNFATGDGDFIYRENAASPSSVNWFGGPASGADMLIHISGLLRTGGTAGTLQLQWAQLVSSALTTWVLQGSWLRLRKVA